VTRGEAAAGDGAEPRRHQVDPAMDSADPSSIGSGRCAAVEGRRGSSSGLEVE
jgi:hypothetical protein